jgi:site-specific DNA recombinase
VETKWAKKEGKAMKTAAIYCRVSTEDQEREGTSLQTQLEACLNYCRDKGYDVVYRFSEAYSGLTLERPKLSELRELVRNERVDVIVCYSLDRLSRDPTHGVILTQEMEKHNVILEAVTETVDGSELGKLISYIRGFASKLEVEKIRERTMRGLRARAQSGKLPGGRQGQLYGYHYIKGKGEGQGIRIPNEDEAKVVKEMYRWLVEENMSVYAITLRLRSLSIPTPSGRDSWNRSTVYAILSNPAYYGKTYVFTRTYTESNAPRKLNRRYRKTHKEFRRKEEWVEIHNATPPIIGEETFQAAQWQLRRNRELATRNAKRKYLLRGFIKCRWCGRTYIGHTVERSKDGQRYELGYYHCGAYDSLTIPGRCKNQWYRVQYLDQVVWEQIETLLANPELVLSEIQKRQESTEEASLLERNWDRVTLQLANREKQKTRIWKAFELTGDEETFRNVFGKYKGTH